MKKTNVKRSDMCKVSSYPGLGVYENTDENGVLDIVIPVPDENICWMYQKHTFNNIVKAIEIMNMAEVELDCPRPQITLVPEKENMVSEDFTLKLMALVVNKEKIKEVK